MKLMEILKVILTEILEVRLTLKVIRIKIEIGCLVMSNYVDIM